MQYEIKAQPAASVVDIRMSAGESITAEVGAMIAMTSGMTVETTSRTKGGKGGMMKGLKRMFAGENFFLNHFSSHSEGQSLILGPQLTVILFRASGMTEAQMVTWAETHRRSGALLCLPTRWRGEMVFRLCIVNPQTDPVQILQVLGSLAPDPDA